MNLFRFRSSKVPSVYAFTSDGAGAALPQNLAPWLQTSRGSQQVAEPFGTPQHVQSGPIYDAIQRDGFYLEPNEILFDESS